MLAELRRIFGSDVVPTAKMNWQAQSPNIVKQARMERGARITKAVSELLDDKNGKLDASVHCQWYMSPPCETLPGNDVYTP